MAPLLTMQPFVRNMPLFFFFRYQFVMNEQSKRMESCPFTMNIVILPMINNQGKLWVPLKWNFEFYYFHNVNVVWYVMNDGVASS